MRSDIYLDDERYEKLIAALVKAATNEDADEIKTVLGCAGGIWPASIKLDLGEVDESAFL
jgi:hypothetical protein